MSVDVVLPDVASAITYLFTAYQKPLDDAVLLVYEHQLMDVPFALVQRAVLEAPHRLSKPFVPGIRELRDLCEVIRQEYLAGHPFVPCDMCRERHPGWDVTRDHLGTPRLVRCDCWHRHRELIRANGLHVPVTRLLQEEFARDGDG